MFFVHLHKADDKSLTASGDTASEFYCSTKLQTLVIGVYFKTNKQTNKTISTINLMFTEQLTSQTNISKADFLEFLYTTA